MKRRLGEMHITVFVDEEDDDGKITEISFENFVTFTPEVGEKHCVMTQPELETIRELKNMACEAAATFFVRVVNPEADLEQVARRLN